MGKGSKGATNYDRVPGGAHNDDQDMEEDMAPPFSDSKERRRQRREARQAMGCDILAGRWWPAGMSDWLWTVTGICAVVHLAHLIIFPILITEADMHVRFLSMTYFTEFDDPLDAYVIEPGHEYSGTTRYGWLFFASSTAMFALLGISLIHNRGSFDAWRSRKDQLKKQDYSTLSAVIDMISIPFLWLTLATRMGVTNTMEQAMWFLLVAAIYGATVVMEVTNRIPRRKFKDNKTPNPIRHINWSAHILRFGLTVAAVVMLIIYFAYFEHKKWDVWALFFIELFAMVLQFLAHTHYYSQTDRPILEYFGMKLKRHPFARLIFEILLTFFHTIRFYLFVWIFLGSNWSHLVPHWN